MYVIRSTARSEEQQTEPVEKIMKKIRVMIADDHDVVRRGLRALIESQTLMEVVGEAADGAGVLKQIAKLTPDILILDIQMPNTVATEIVGRVAKASPRTRVLILSMHDDPIYIESLMTAGARGYLVKSSASSLIVEAIRAILDGEIYLDPDLSSSRQPAPPQPVLQEASAREDNEVLAKTGLTKREKEVLALLARGHTHREISTDLGISINTVGTYRSRLNQKLGLKARADLVVFAKEAGIL
jgi:two-component system response regulator NreC